MSIRSSEAARIMGSIKSERKAKAARKNAERAGRPAKPLAEFHCNCGAGDTAFTGHKSLCPRGRKIRRLQEQGKPLV
jgi:hypothetical protein